MVDNKLPGEKATVLATGGMEMTVERADPASLGGSAIGEGPASFKMPASGDLFKNANSSNMGDVDKQVSRFAGKRWKNVGTNMDRKSAKR